MGPNKCLNCTYRRGSVCRRYPPAIFEKLLAVEQNGRVVKEVLTHLSFFPEIQFDWCCGEYLRETEEGK